MRGTETLGQHTHSTFDQHRIVNLRPLRDSGLLDAGKLTKYWGTTRMIVRAVGAIALLLIPLESEVFASRHHRPTARISCSEVRYYVAKYSAPVAEIYARNHGASDAQIERARRCLASNETAETERSAYTH